MIRRFIAKISPTYQLVKAQNEKINYLTHELDNIHKKLTYLYIKHGAGSSLESGERQVFDNVDSFRLDHRERYEFAMKTITEDSHVLDIACGVGYGCHFISEVSGTQVTGVDISEDAIQFAKKHFSQDNISFICSSVEAYNPDRKFDFVTSFETIEHIEDDYGFVTKIFTWMNTGGVLLCSVPNEDKLPHSHSRFPFHFKHYTESDLDNLLRSVGFSEISYFSQVLDTEGIKDGTEGHFILAIARK